MNDQYFNGELVSVDAGDLNDDGITDLVVGVDIGNYFGSLIMYIMLNADNGRQFTYFNIYTGPYAISSLLIDDFDNDGKQNDIGYVITSSGLITSSKQHPHPQVIKLY